MMNSQNELGSRPGGEARLTLRRLAIAALICGVGALGAACDRKPPPPASSSPETQEAPASSASSPAPSSAEASPKPPASADAPKQKKVEATPDAALGTLAKGLGLPPGKRIPNVSAVDVDGRERPLRELTRDKPTVLVFYRGGWCPFCNFQIRELVESVPAFEKRGVQLAAISVDKMDEASRTSATYSIPFPVLSDPELRVHRAFKVVHQADDEEVERLKGFGIDLERSSGEQHHAFAVPSVFVIGGDGVVRWAHADLDYKVRPTPAQLLAVIDSLGPLR